MHSSSTATANDAFLDYLLHLVDQMGDRLGLNVPPVVPIEQLRDLPLGTLGRSLADFLDQEKLAPFQTGPRRKQLHDSVHVLTGYGADPIGEAEVQAFLLGAKFHPAHLLLMGGLLRMIHRRVVPLPLLHTAIRQRLWAAYWHGQRSTFDVDTWQPEAQWHLPLSQVKALFHL
ncbi:hypothetical protein [Stenomitos frigidus]|uniref:Uncharacterized protein n=1 Tax=Stenomitos frigidus ULC18 TaxID=2107698 RepID=A0A2T1DSX2_9CYAN|nr:hypothetical protein [Stenomitos frigidus]PSB23603.1 hypothetical protein C7B82_30450 [Stenomitos frigidus ULC18]